jgi:hypothetical protein
MADKPDVLEMFGRKGLAGALDQEKDSEQGTCAAFGYLRGLDAQALAVEFRYQTGNRDWFPYSWLGPWRFDPSVGLLLKFTGDAVSLVLIHGSNLDMDLPERGINLLDRGFQRHRIVYVREMDEDELRQAGASEPTIDSIEVAEFESPEEQREWLMKNAAAFLRP